MPPDRSRTNPSHRDIARHWATQAARHNRSAHGSEESCAIAPQAQQGGESFAEASLFMPQAVAPINFNYIPNLLPPQALPRTHLSPGDLADWHAYQPSPGLHHMRAASDSTFQGNPATWQADVHSFVPLTPFLTPVGPGPSHASVNSAYGAIPVAVPYTQPTCPYGYLAGWNTQFLPLANEEIPRALRNDAPRGDAPRNDASRNSVSAVPESSLQGNHPVESDRLNETFEEFYARFMADIPSQSTSVTPTSQPPEISAPGSLKASSGPGLADDSPAAKPTEQMKVNMECKICFAQLASIVLIPCGKFGLAICFHDR